ncbi:hypothetical protein BGX27_011467 [Mortierella sp. AM989]|nr:hypothetical protein BGX27_011467 [Mortierella sp. AM989]
MISGTRFNYGRCIRQSTFISFPIRNSSITNGTEITSRVTRILVRPRLATLPEAGGGFHQFRELSTRKTPKGNEKSKSAGGGSSKIDSSSGTSNTRSCTSSKDKLSTTAPVVNLATSRPVSSKSNAEESSRVNKSDTHVNIDNIPDYKHSKTPPRQELEALQSLVDELLLTNSVNTKREILTRHLEQAPLLAWIYDPLRQFNVTSSGVMNYAQLRPHLIHASMNAATETKMAKTATFHSEFTGKQGEEAIANGQGYDTLPALLNALSTRAIVGHAALDAIIFFMGRFCSNRVNSFDRDNSRSNVSDDNPMEQLFNTQLSKLFLKILDKNLKTGCNVNLIREVCPTLISGFHTSLSQSLSGLEDARKLFKSSESEIDTSTASTRTSKKKSRVKDDAGWFASRKLDGVRCLTRVDRLTGGIESLSRNGRSFENLTSIQEALRYFMSSHNEIQNSDGTHDPRSWDQFFKRALDFGESEKKETLPEALYLDGEVCIFEGEPLPEFNAQAEKGDLESEGVVTIGGGDEGFGRENFLRSVSFAKRGLAKEEQNDDGKANNNVRLDKDSVKSEIDSIESATPVYCMFDCLTETEFKDRKGARPFSKRVRGMAAAFSLEDAAKNDTLTSHALAIKILKQTKIESVAQLEKMIALSADRGWEGIILRKDVGYEGKRSRNMLKIKKFHDAEFIVQEAMVGSMRVSLHGQFEERDNVLTNVVVLHRGNKVRVGSGFSMEDRIRFGKDPSLIIGKTITVQYFEESQSMVASGGGQDGTVTTLNKGEEASDGANEGAEGVWSLRFPTVKAIYEDGPRQI